MGCFFLLETIKICNGYQTVVPLKIREELNITSDDIIEWCLNKEKRTVELSFVKKKIVLWI